MNLEHYFDLPIASALIRTVLASMSKFRLIGAEDLRDAASRQTLVLGLLEGRDSTSKHPQIDLHRVGYDEATECIRLCLSRRDITWPLAVIIGRSGRDRMLPAVNAGAQGLGFQVTDDKDNEGLVYLRGRAAMGDGVT